MSTLARVSKKFPCIICQKTSWCMVGKDDALCMRVSSERPFTLKNSGEIGYWHRLDKAVERPPMPKRWQPPASINTDALMNEFDKTTESGYIESLANQLGVSWDSLISMNVAYAARYSAWAFPMRDEFGKPCGIRLRGMDGRKWCVTGSKTGIFLPYCQVRNTVFLVEGPTDCAALLTLGFYAIGRPSNSGGLDIIKQTVKRLGIQRAVIIADNDEDKEVNGRKFNAGYDGAASLARNIGIPCCIMALPTKDARSFLQNGGTREMLESQMENMLWDNH